MQAVLIDIKLTVTTQELLNLEQGVLWNSGGQKSRVKVTQTKKNQHNLRAQ